MKKTPHQIGVKFSNLLPTQMSRASKTLKGNFKQSHKSCIVNVDNILTVDSCNNIITFINGKHTNLLSSRMRKSFEEYVLDHK